MPFQFLLLDVLHVEMLANFKFKKNELVLKMFLDWTDMHLGCSIPNPLWCKYVVSAFPFNGAVPIYASKGYDPLTLHDIALCLGV